MFVSFRQLRMPIVISANQSRPYLAVFDTVAGFFIDLIKADFLSLAVRAKQRNGTRFAPDDQQPEQR